MGWASLDSHVHSRGRVIVLSVGCSVCLSAPSQDFEQNRLVYGLYLLRMSQKYINLYESVLQGAEKSRLFGFVKTIDLYLERLLPL